MKKIGSFGFSKIKKKLNDLERTLPVKIGNQAVVVFQTNFIAGGFIDKNREKWKEKKDGKDSHLIKTGKLRRDVKLQPGANINRILIATSLPYAAIHNFGGQIKKKERTGSLSFRRQMGPSLPGQKTGLVLVKSRYKKQRSEMIFKHTHTIGAHNINIPQRKFIGNSDYLNKQILFLIKQEVSKIFIR